MESQACLRVRSQPWETKACWFTWCHLQSECGKQVPSTVGLRQVGELHQGMPCCFVSARDEGAAEIPNLVTETHCKTLP